MNSSTNLSNFSKAYNPVFQALFSFAFSVVIILGSFVAKLTGWMEVGQRFPWLVGAAFLLFYAMFNAIFCLSAKNILRYWQRSILSFIALLAVTSLFAYLTSSLGLSEAGSFQWIYMVLSFGYLVFLSMVTFLRNIVEYAMREEWNAPKSRYKKKK